MGFLLDWNFEIVRNTRTARIRVRRHGYRYRRDRFYRPFGRLNFSRVRIIAPTKPKKRNSTIVQRTRRTASLFVFTNRRRSR